MKYLKNYPIFESNGLTLEQEEFLDEHTNGTWSLNSEGLVDIEGDFDCSFSGLKILSGVRFGNVSGDFDCSHNQLTSLEGAPQEVGGDFDCSFNKLDSLGGAPREVGGRFSCSRNKLTSLEGAPNEVGSDFICSNNKLVNLDGAPQEIGRDFYCDHNQLISLEGAPKKYNEIFWTEDGEVFVVTPTEKAIENGSVLVWDLVPEKDRSNKLNDFIENDPSNIDRLNVLFDRDWYTPSPYAMAIYKAWKRGL